MRVGQFIWNLARCDDGDVGKILTRCRTNGIDHLIIKINDGSRIFNGNKLRPVFDALRAGGIETWAWAYTYGRDPEREAEAFGVRAIALGVSNIVVDAEGDSYTSSPQRASRYMASLRGVVGGMHVGLSSHRYPSNHKSFPWAAFLAESQTWWPQAYYLQQGAGVVRNLQRVLDEGQKFGKPMIVTGATYKTKEGDAVGKPENVATFLRICELAGIEAVNFWSYEHAKQPIWDIIRTYTGGTTHAT